MGDYGFRFVGVCRCGANALFASSVSEPLTRMTCISIEDRDRLDKRFNCPGCDKRKRAEAAVDLDWRVCNAEERAQADALIAEIRARK